MRKKSLILLVLGIVAVLVHCPEVHAATSGVFSPTALLRYLEILPALLRRGASLTTKIHPELTTRTSRTVH